MPSASYHQVGDSDHDPAVIRDAGCEVSPKCVRCPLSRCKFDDIDWYRDGIRRAADLVAANDIQREGLTLGQAAVRYRTTKRTISRIRQRSRQVANVLTAEDVAVFTRLADGRRRRGIEEPRRAAR